MWATGALGGDWMLNSSFGVGSSTVTAHNSCTCAVVWLRPVVASLPRVYTWDLISPIGGISAEILSCSYGQETMKVSKLHLYKNLSC